MVDPVDFIFGRNLRGIDCYDLGGRKGGNNKSKTAKITKKDITLQHIDTMGVL